MALTFERLGPESFRITRKFRAPPSRVFAAFTDPAILRQWLPSPEGWSMPVCEADVQPGGTARFAWKSSRDEGEMQQDVTYEVVEKPNRLVQKDRTTLGGMVQESRVETRLDPLAGGTRMTVVTTLPSQALDVMVSMGAEQQMEQGYARLDNLL